MIVFLLLGWVCISVEVKGLFILQVISFIRNKFIKKIMYVEKLYMGAKFGAPESNGAGLGFANLFSSCGYCTTFRSILDLNNSSSVDIEGSYNNNISDINSNKQKNQRGPTVKMSLKITKMMH